LLASRSPLVSTAAVPSTLHRQVQTLCTVSTKHAAASVPSTCRVSSEHIAASVPGIVHQRMASARISTQPALHGSLSTIEYFTFGFGTMIGVGWVVLMDDWLSRGGPGGGIL